MAEDRAADPPTPPPPPPPPTEVAPPSPLVREEEKEAPGVLAPTETAGEAALEAVAGEAAGDAASEAGAGEGTGEAAPEAGAGEGVGQAASEAAADEARGEAATLEEDAVESTPRGAYVDAPASPLASFRQHVRHVRSNSFQRWRRQVQRAWRWGSSGNNGEFMSPDIREQALRATANLEVMANQKRQWYRIKSTARDYKEPKEPTSLFEHFVIVGLGSNANVEVIEDAFAKRKIWESEVAKSEILDLRKLQYHGCMPILEPQILFKYPPGKRMAMKENELPSFCFPEGVKARLIQKTPSMSDLNEVVFGQDHHARDDLSFVFCLKGSDNAPLYGVCLHVQEIVQRAPGILGAVSPLTSPSKPSRFLVSAPRCYCILTRVPFFELHFEMLNSIIAQERLDRITTYVSEMTLVDPIPHGVNLQEEQDASSDSPDRQFLDDWTEYAIPVDSVSGLISYSSLLSEREVPAFSSRNMEPPSPESASASEVSDVGQLREFDKDRRVSQLNDDFVSETSGSRSDSFERLNGCFENGETSPDVSSAYNSVNGRLQLAESLESIYSSVKEIGSDEEESELIQKHETNVADEKVLEWAKAHNNEPLQIVCGYHALPLPPRGGEIVFYPLEHLQPVQYCRPGVSSLELGTDLCNVDGEEQNEPKLSNEWLSAAEEALALSVWTVAAVCRALSLETVLALFAGTLLEKQVVVICPNLGLLSAIVLSVVPMIRPFQWQSLLLPVLPRKMLDFLDAPVPYIVGIQHKPTEFKIKTTNLVRIDVNKDQVKSSGLPQLPNYRELVSDLRPIHARLICENSVAKRHPVHRCSEVQAEGARDFLIVMRRYLESLCFNLRSHTITNVQSNNDKVSLLLKDSFIDSFPIKHRPFIKLFVDTQLFSVLSDHRLSRYESERSEQTN